MEGLPWEITPQELKRRLEAGENICLIDVREPFESRICQIDGAEAVPMRLIPQAVPSLTDKAARGTLVFFCDHGIRSLQVVCWLRRNGVPGCQSLERGIDGWSVLVDPAVPGY